MNKFTTKIACVLCVALLAGGTVQAANQIFNYPIHTRTLETVNSVPNISGQYLGKLNVTVDESTADEADESVTIEVNDDFTEATFILENFFLIIDNEATPIGTIRIPNIPIETEGNVVKLKSSVDINIEPGDDELLEGSGLSFWLGTLLGEIPIELEATIEKDVVDVDIDIILPTGEDAQIIEVHFAGAKKYPDAVTTIEEEKNEAYVYRIDGNSIGISGIEEGSYYQIYSHTGALVMNGILRSTTINTERLMQGIYLFRVGNQVLKFVR